MSYQLQLELFQCLLVFHYVERTLHNDIHSLYELGVVQGWHVKDDLQAVDSRDCSNKWPECYKENTDCYIGLNTHNSRGDYIQYTVYNHPTHNSRGDYIQYTVYNHPLNCVYSILYSNLYMGWLYTVYALFAVARELVVEIKF